MSSEVTGQHRWQQSGGVGNMGHVLKIEPTGPADMLTVDTEGKGRTGSDSASATRPCSGIYRDRQGGDGVWAGIGD